MTKPDRKQTPSPPERTSTGHNDGVAPRVDPSQLEGEQQGDSQHDPVNPPHPGMPTPHRNDPKRPDKTL